MMFAILVVDDERSQREILDTILSKEGYRVATVSGGEEALEHLASEVYDIVLTDLKMRGISGQVLLERVHHLNPEQCVIMMTAHGSVDSAVEAMKKGAFDYLEKPLEKDELLLTLRRAVENISLRRENLRLHKKLQENQTVSTIIGDHPKMMEMFRVINKIAATSSTVLINGESGTGKELVARAVHDGSPRRNNLFFAINCAAIPDSLIESELFGHEKGAFTGANSREIGIFEAADKGTIFLDEIGEMNMAMQAKLLRAIQEKEIRRVGGKVNIPVDVRIISATNKDLEQELRQGNFREDLFYRLNVIRISLPPLRERGHDIITLAEFFVKKYSAAAGIPVKEMSRLTLKLLMDYSWPGNVRQLESAIERGVLMSEGKLIQPEDLPSEIQREKDYGGTLAFKFPAEGISFEDLEQDLIVTAMERAGWVIGKAAPLLGMSYKTLQYRLDKYNIRKRGLDE